MSRSKSSIYSNIEDVLSQAYMISQNLAKLYSAPLDTPEKMHQAHLDLHAKQQDIIIVLIELIEASAFLRASIPVWVLCCLHLVKSYFANTISAPLFQFILTTTGAVE